MTFKFIAAADSIRFVEIELQHDFGAYRRRKIHILSPSLKVEKPLELCEPPMQPNMLIIWT